ncbi:hypothetical protein [Polaribacter glomeratus]|uniref:Uncharacterized protein n=1 Tax=Polaribacter glomeratus TaxID=102 RepID=A0A2S7WGF3_9FLAO|nr:hypothetical protein [Polaribacter glomeratus]PQJ76698.1 hypothetical protein BTO16_12500 [Polaribacter glomeratus]TXD67460.1 hypothetical protein ESX12_02415 [Polaribacter glomeratus]
MKKVFLILVFVLATGTSFMNASSANDEFLPITKPVIEIEEDFGCASRCVGWARGLVVDFAERNEDDPNDNQFYMDIYMRYYTGCLRGC